MQLKVVLRFEADRGALCSARQAVLREVAKGLTDTLNTIDSDTRVDNTPWPPASWTDREKTQKNADFTRAMRASPMDESLILEIGRAHV